MSVHPVSVIGVGDFGSETFRIGDLNGDGAPDLLFVQNLYNTRTITCLTATTIMGEVLWQTGVPSQRNGFTYGDLPVQIYDWDGDGRNEVLYVQQAQYAELYPDTPYAVQRARRYEGTATMIVLDGTTGREKGRFAIPAPADGAFLFANLTGGDQRSDLVVKDEYWNMWGITHDGRELWRWTGSTGHYPAIADIDGDGRDEVFVGFALVDHDGRPLFEHRPHDLPEDAEWDDPHQDAACMVQRKDGSWRLIFGNHGLHCLDAEGHERWDRPLREAQHVVPGHFRDDSDIQLMVVNRGNCDSCEPATLYLYDLDGNEIWRREQPRGSWAVKCERVNWSGPGMTDMALVSGRSHVITVPRGEEIFYHCPQPLPRDPNGLCTVPDGATEILYLIGNMVPEAIYDGDGNVVDTLTMQYAAGVSEEERMHFYYAHAADVWGDSREEIILSGTRGCCIMANARPLAVPTLYNETIYTGV